MSSRPIRLVAAATALAVAGGAWVATSRTGPAPDTTPTTPAVAAPAPDPFEVLPAPPLVPRTHGHAAGGATAPALPAATRLQDLIEDRAARTGIPEAAVRAYVRGELRAPAGCHLSWTTLAGIGHVESFHGSFGGARLQESGVPTEAILGPALDGVGPVAAIPATPAGTRLHGDRVWEHAVGPLQFLPGTWDTWGVDADDDGRADPHDLDDAATAAAGYLCAGGRDLLVEGAWKQAVLAYNHELGYVMDVYAASATYAALGG